MEKEQAKKQTTNVEYCFGVVGADGASPKLHEYIDAYVKRHPNSEILLMMVDLNIVLRESSTGKSWIIASTGGHNRQLYDYNDGVLEPREEHFTIQVFTSKRKEGYGSE